MLTLILIYYYSLIHLQLNCDYPFSYNIFPTSNNKLSFPWENVNSCNHNHCMYRKKICVMTLLKRKWCLFLWVFIISGEISIFRKRKVWTIWLVPCSTTDLSIIRQNIKEPDQIKWWKDQRCPEKRLRRG